MTIFHYKKENSFALGKIQRPVADVFLRTETNSWIEFNPYIDSGADITMIPLSFGKLIGFQVDESKIQQIGGINGSVPVIYKKAVVKIGKKILTVRIAWALIEDVPPLLGRTDVWQTNYWKKNILYCFFRKIIELFGDKDKNNFGKNNVWNKGCNFSFFNLVKKRSCFLLFFFIIRCYEANYNICVKNYWLHGILYFLMWDSIAISLISFSVYFFLSFGTMPFIVESV